MTANVFEIKKFAVHDGDGIRTTVFLKGCPLKCVWCHNPEGISSKPQLAVLQNKCILCGRCELVCKNHKIADIHTLDRNQCIGCGKCAEACFNGALTLYGKEKTAEELLKIVMEDKEFYDTSGGGVTLSGGECLMQPEFCRDFLKLLKHNGVNTAVDTCGCVKQDVYDMVIPYTDVFLYDVKAIDEDVHIKCTGVSNRLILDNLKYIDSRGSKIEIRIPYVPDFNDNQIEKIGSFLNEFKNIVGVRVLPYHNYAGSKYESLSMENTLPGKVPKTEEMETAERIIESFGLRVIR
ncbi:MAG: glycyl-radical enzyme activating protein [Clostridia bacterium]|nr:glycyl-radical enzyme activating protein [Clostridia bacterium]